jgi:hypothetical protein
VLARALVVLAVLASTFLGAGSVARADEGTTEVCRFTDQRFDEISGMTYSQVHENVIYLHNDSSGGPVIYAVDSTTCRTLATLTIAGIDARDLEAIGSGRDAKGRPILWLADIGDNRDSWPDVRLHRIREPRTLRDQTLTPRTYRFTYADRPHNAEALLADPGSTRVWVVTKQSARGRLYRLPTRLSTTRINIARPVRDEGAFITDGSVSPDGSRYALRDYVDAQVFSGLPPGLDPVRIYLPLQLQGEAMTWTPDGAALLVAGERDDRLLRVDLELAAAPISAPAASSSATTSTTTSAPPSVQALSSDPPVEQQELSTRGGESGAVGSAAGMVLAFALVALGGLVIATAEWRRRRARGAPPG